MGRREKPVDRTSVVRGRLADLLRATRSAAGLNYVALADRTGVSAATLKRAASGGTLPSEATVEKFLESCGAPPQDVERARDLYRSARVEQGGPVGAAVPLERVSTAPELGAALVSLHRGAGSPSYRRMQERGGSMWLPLSSLSRILNRKTVPVSHGQMSAFLLGCDCPEERRGQWLRAWERATRRYRTSGSHRSPEGEFSPNVLLRRTAHRAGVDASRPGPTRSLRAQWGRDLLDVIDGSGGIDTHKLARRAGMPVQAVADVLEWLRSRQLVVTDVGAHFPGPALEPASRRGPDRALFSAELAILRDDVGAAVYFGRYLDGEVVLQECADSAMAPRVDEWVSFRETAHASAIGKSLLVQLDSEARMDHLSRHPPVKLTARTMTKQRDLFASLDRVGPGAPQFSFLEYSPETVCAALPLRLPDGPSTIALSLPAQDAPRVVSSALLLGKRIDRLLLPLLLASDPLAEVGAGTRPFLEDDVGHKRTAHPAADR